MASSTVSITLDVEPIVKLVCFEVSCRFNAAKLLGEPTCELKHLEIGPGGQCAMRESLLDKQPAAEQPA